MKNLFNLNYSLSCTIIVCTTILFLSVIALLAYRIYQKRTCTFGSYIFLSSVLLVFAITIFSNCFCKDRNVLDFISLASALISIVLAIVTIIYSYFTNSRTSGQIEKLNKAANDVSLATGAYSQSANELQNNIVRIIQAVDDVNQKTDKIYAEMAKPFTKNVAHQKNNKTTHNEFTINLDDFFQKAARLEVVVLYLCIKSMNSNKAWQVDKLFPELYGALGVLMTLHSTGLITIDIDYEKILITVHDYNQEIEAYVTQYIEMVRKEKDLKDINEILQKIDLYFD